MSIQTYFFQVPPFVNDIAAVLPWLLESAPIPLSYCYQSVAVNLHFACNSNGDYHIHPLDAHLRIAIICLNRVLHNFYPLTVWQTALDAVKDYIPIRWGKKYTILGSSTFIRWLLFYLAALWTGSLIFYSRLLK
jgi:hypothetical protein